MQNDCVPHCLISGLLHNQYARGLNGYAGTKPRRKQGPTVVHQKPGPLQTIFDLLPDEASFMLHHPSFVFICHMFLLTSYWGVMLHRYGDNEELVIFRLLNIAILVHLRGHFCTMAECTSLPGTSASTLMYFQSKWRLDCLFLFAIWIHRRALVVHNMIYTDLFSFLRVNVELDDYNRTAATNLSIY